METIITLIIPCLLLFSEALSLIPKVKSNGIFQMIYNIIKWLASKPAPTTKNGG